MTHSDRNGRLVGAGLLILTLAVFARVVTFGYVIWDDQINIYENPYLTGESSGALARFWTGPFQGLYIPVTYTVWFVVSLFAGKAIDFEISKEPVLNPAWFHGANLVVHLASVCLVFLLIRSLLGKRDAFAAGLGAALFAIHPLQVEPVAWATGMKDVFSAFIGLCAIAVFLRNSRSQVDKDGSLFAGPGYAIALLLYVLGLLSKPGIVMLPFAIFLLDTAIQHTPWKKAAGALIPFVLIGIGVAVATTIVQFAPDEASGERPSVSALPLYQRPIVALDALTLYFSKLVYPLGLVTQYDRSPAHAVRMATHFPIWIVSILFAAAVLRIRRHRNYYVAGFGVAFLFLFPVLGFVPFGFQRVSTIADRYMYFPMFGVGLALAAWLTFSKSAVPKIVAATALAAFTVLSVIQVPVWKGPTALFSHTYKVNPRSVAAATNLGAAAFNTGNFEEALVHYKRLLTINADNARSYSLVGHLCNETGRYEEAIPYLQKAIDLDPGNPGPYRDMGTSRFRLSEFDAAILHYRKALELEEPDSVETIINLGAALSNTEALEEAAACFRRAMELDLVMWQPCKGLGTVLMDLGRADEAVGAFQAMIERNPGNPAGYSMLADAFAAGQRFPEAIDAAARSVAIAGNTPGFQPEQLDRFRKQLDDLRKRATP